MLATTDVLERARTAYATDAEPLLVKGKDRAVHRPARRRSSREARDASRSTRCRSSDAKPSSRSCAGAVDTARLRQLQLVELVGEPGIGKSRLVRRAAGRSHSASSS